MFHPKIVIIDCRRVNIMEQLYSRYCYYTEVEPVPRVPEICEGINYIPSGAHLYYSFYGVDTRKHIPKENHTNNNGINQLDSCIKCFDKIARNNV